MVERAEHDILRRHGVQIARAVAGAPVISGEVGVAVLKRSDTAVTMRVTAGGKERIAKVFLPNAVGSRDGFNRERICLTAINGEGLAPRPVAALSDAGCIVTEAIDGRPLSQVISAKNLQNYARQIGMWLRLFTTAMPSETADGTWWDYLEKVDGGTLAQKLEPHRAIFAVAPLKRVGVARNDGHLSNFLVTDKVELVGIDFANAQVKPVGWDLMLAARSLARMFPGQTRNFVPDLMDGWRGSRKKKLVIPTGEMVRVFAETTGLPG